MEEAAFTVQARGRASLKEYLKLNCIDPVTSTRRERSGSHSTPWSGKSRGRGWHTISWCPEPSENARTSRLVNLNQMIQACIELKTKRSLQTSFPHLGLKLLRSWGEYHQYPPKPYCFFSCRISSWKGQLLLLTPAWSGLGPIVQNLGLARILNNLQDQPELIRKPWIWKPDQLLQLGMLLKLAL